MAKIALCNDPECWVASTEGTLISVNGSSNVSFEGRVVALVGDKVRPHPPYPNPNDNEHQHATLITGSPDITIGGIAVVREGDLASCGHPVTVTANTITGD